MQIAENEGEPETNYSLVSRQVRGGSKHYLPHTRPKWCTQLYHVKFCLGNLGICLFEWQTVNLLKPTDYVLNHQFSIQQLYALPTLYLCVLYLSQKKQQLVPLTA